MEAITSDLYDLESENEDEDVEKHEQLLLSFGVDVNAEAKGASKGQRTEPSQDVSIFPLSGERDVSDTSDLLTSLKNTANTDSIRTQINKIEKSTKHLKPALPQVVSDRIERRVAYGTTSKDLSKWDSIVERNRKSEHLHFPINSELKKRDTLDDFVNRFNPSTPLEQQIYEMLNGSKLVERPNKNLSIAEEEAVKSMSLEEAKIRIADLQKHRALMSYHEAKNKRQSKIKSKSYRRMKRKQKEKEDIKELEKLEQEDPEAASQKLEKALLLRAEERAGQRHKHGSKWSRNRKMIGKYDELSRLQLNEQSKIHKELTEKPTVLDDDDIAAINTENKEEDYIGLVAPTTNIQRFDVPQNNPWLKHSTNDGKTDREQDDQSKTTVAANDNITINKLESLTNVLSSDDDEENDSDCEIKDELNEIKEAILVQKKTNESDISAFTQAFQNLQEEEKKLIEDSNETDQIEDSIIENMTDDVDPSEEVNQYELLLSTDRIKTLDDADNILNKSKLRDDDNLIAKKSSKPNQESKPLHPSKNLLDPNKVFALPVMEINDDGDDSVLGANAKNKLSMQEAFTDDDVVNNFIEEKNKIVDESAPKVEDIEMPGWGSWGGAGELPVKRKKKQPIKRTHGRVMTRADGLMGHVIINHKHNISLAKYQVNDVPYPFTSQEQYERSIRQPIGKTWNTERAFTKLTIPKVTTKLGEIIQPMSKEESFDEQRKKIKTNIRRNDSDSKPKKRQRGKKAKKEKSNV